MLKKNKSSRYALQLVGDRHGGHVPTDDDGGDAKDIADEKDEAAVGW